jgi:2-polyprenyl-3-methyl-5-hydroxy-6-metoxy-1,4-benzoquinol methylase
MSATLIDTLLQEIARLNPLQEKFLHSSLALALPEELDDLAAYLEFSRSQGLTIEYLAGCYDLIVKDTLREQLYFQRRGRYRYSSYAEVAQSVYFNDAYMRQYMHGLALTGALWPNHRQLHRFFADVIPRKTAGRYLEIGPGHGVYMLTALRHCAYTSYEGIDLSPTSVAMTSALLGRAKYGVFGNASVRQADFLEDPELMPPFAAIVMGEVLEHVEQPQAFLRKIHALAASDAFIFITTPVNAPAIDHIFLFDSVESVRQLVRDSGFAIAAESLAPYPGLSVDESTRQRLPINVALVLRK